MLVCLDSLMIILGHPCVAILLEKMLMWAPFSQSMCSFSLCINPWYFCDEKKGFDTQQALISFIKNLKKSSSNREFSGAALMNFWYLESRSCNHKTKCI